MANPVWSDAGQQVDHDSGVLFTTSTPTQRSLSQDSVQAGSVAPVLVDGDGMCFGALSGEHSKAIAHHSGCASRVRHRVQVAHVVISIAQCVPLATWHQCSVRQSVKVMYRLAPLPT